jgi:hypothetical protein
MRHALGLVVGLALMGVVTVVILFVAFVGSAP